MQKSAQLGRAKSGSPFNWALGVKENNMEVIIEGPSFYDIEDENVFFNCLYSLPEYEKVIGKGINLHINLKEPVSDQTAKQLVIVCRRWKINIEPLEVFHKPSNSKLSLWEHEIEYATNT